MSTIGVGGGECWNRECHKIFWRTWGGGHKHFGGSQVGCKNFLSYSTSNMCQYYGTTMQLGWATEIVCMLECGPWNISACSAVIVDKSLIYHVWTYNDNRRVWCQNQNLITVEYLHHLSADENCNILQAPWQGVTTIIPINSSIYD